MLCFIRMHPTTFVSLFGLLFFIPTTGRTNFQPYGSGDDWDVSNSVQRADKPDPGANNMMNSPAFRMMIENMNKGKNENDKGGESSTRRDHHVKSGKKRKHGHKEDGKKTGKEKKRGERNEERRKGDKGKGKRKEVHGKKKSQSAVDDSEAQMPKKKAAQPSPLDNLTEEELFGRMRIPGTVPTTPGELVRHFVLRSYLDLKNRVNEQGEDPKAKEIPNVTVAAVIQMYVQFGVSREKFNEVVNSHPEFDQTEMKELVAKFKENGITSAIVAKSCGVPIPDDGDDDEDSVSPSKKRRIESHRKPSVQPLKREPLKLAPVHADIQGPLAQHFPYEPQVKPKLPGSFEFVGTSSKTGRESKQNCR